MNTGNFFCTTPTAYCSGGGLPCNTGQAPDAAAGSGIGPASGSNNPDDNDPNISCTFWGWQGPGSPALGRCNSYVSIATDGVCDTDFVNGCKAGTLNDTADNSTDRLWKCLGSGGVDANCSKPLNESDWYSLGCGTTSVAYNAACSKSAAAVTLNCASTEHAEVRDIFGCTASSVDNPTYRQARCVLNSDSCGRVATPLCGSGNGSTLTSAPAESTLCAAGTASGVSGTGPWNWTCSTDTSVSCSALTCSAVCTPGPS